MFELSVTDHFSAAHSLAGYPGACANVHGHNYTVTLVVSCSDLDEIGIGIDLKALKLCLKEVLEPLDHTNLNDLPAFSGAGKEGNPSSENLARHIFNELRKPIKNSPARLKEVIVAETDGSTVKYIPD
jgi:6-pyruvoyltetrahydropterin/6-carboxytetrahydropterin synthase